MSALGMGGHHSAVAQKHEWLSPPKVVSALGPFDLDPCAPVLRPWDTAARHLTIEDDGLFLPWVGRVWLNPPYGSSTGEWLAKLADHGNGIALIFARTETEDWRAQVWSRADGILFIHGRLYFHHASGERAAANSGAPSALIAYGNSNVAALINCGIAGHLVERWRPIHATGGTSR